MSIVSVPLTQGKIALIDEEDAERVLSRLWCANWHHDRWYAVTDIARRIVYLHDFIMGDGVGGRIDHVDGDGLNCTRGNMRHATSAQNAWNVGKHRGNRSGFKGVSWSKVRQKWVVFIRANGEHHYLGYFRDINDAAMAYDESARRLHGEFARLNFPQEGERSALSVATKTQTKEDTPSLVVDAIGLIRSLQSRGWTQRAIAGAIGVDKGSVNRWFTGRGRPQERIAARLIALAREGGEQ